MSLQRAVFLAIRYVVSVLAVVLVGAFIGYRRVYGLTDSGTYSEEEGKQMTGDDCGGS